MEQHVLGKWYLRSVIKVSDQSEENFIPYENLKSMYILLEEDGSFATYDSENNYNGFYILEYEIFGSLFEKGTLTIENIEKTNFAKWNDNDEEERALLRCSDVINDLLQSKSEIQHFVKDDRLNILTEKYMIICQRERIFKVNNYKPYAPPERYNKFWSFV